MKKSAKQGYEKAQNTVGYMYEKGLGVRRDYKEAVRWYREAAECGYPYAEYNLAGMYYKGKGVKQNLSSAYSWYKRCAAHGLESGKTALKEKFNK